MCTPSTIPPTRSAIAWERVRRSGPLGAVLLGCGLAFAACGGGSPGPSVAHVSSPPTPTPTSTPKGSHPATGAGTSRGGGSLLAYSRCMRTHGVPSFPDPVSGPNGQQGLEINGGPGTGLDPNSTQFRSAAQACQHLQPAGIGPSAAQIARNRASALRFSACMRAHGEPGFPDPTFQGGSTRLAISKSSGIDPSSPQFQAAQQACQSLGEGGPLMRSGSGPTSVRG